MLSPTRELATQTAETFRALGRAAQGLDARDWYGATGDTSGKVPLKVVAVHGGVSYERQRVELRGGAAVLVATPGRLLELLESEAVRARVRVRVRARVRVRVRVRP